MELEEISEKHDLESFSCGVNTIDEYLKTQALSDCKNLLSKTYVVADGKKIVAFCTVILHSLKDGEKEFFIDKNRCSQQRVPALLIGQLAVDKEHKGKGIGASLIQKMISNALLITDYVHFPVIIVDAHSQNLVSYYQDKGFKSFKDKGLRLFLPMAEIIKTFKEAKGH